MQNFCGKVKGYCSDICPYFKGKYDECAFLNKPAKDWTEEDIRKLKRGEG